MNTELVVVTFNDSTGADEMLQALQELQDEEFIEVLDAVIVTKDNNHNVEIRRPLQVIAQNGAPDSDFEYLPVDEVEPGGSSLTVYIDEIWLDQVEYIAAAYAASIEREIVREQRHMAHQQAKEMRKERIDTAYQSWQASLDDLRTKIASLNQQVANHVQSQNDALRRQLESARAKLDATNKKIAQTLHAWQRQVDANIQELEAKAKTADATTKAEIDKRLASAKESQQALRTRVKDSLASRLSDLKLEINSLKAQAAKATGQAKEKINQQVATLQAGWEAEEKRLAQLESADDAVWEQMVKSINEALDTYEASIRTAEEVYEAA